MGRAPPGVTAPDFFMDAQGRWFVDGELILHVRTTEVLTQNVRLAPDGIWVTSIGHEEAPMRFADVPYFVRSAALVNARLDLLLSDGSSEALSAARFRRGDDDGLYVAVKDGGVWARFSRAAYQALLPHWQAEGEALVLRLADGPAILR